MLQKRNDLELIEVVRKEESHIRKISVELDIAPSTVMRIAQRLEKERVLDHKVEGRNKKYYLKDTPEARSYLFMTEEYKLLKLLQSPELRRIIKELISKTDNELIILFGSHAKGTAKKDSDIDIYIETSDKKIPKDLQLISEKLQIKIGKFNKDNSLSREIVKNHVIIQNKDRFYMLLR